MDNKITIVACSLMAIFGFGFYALGTPTTTSIGNDIIISGSAAVGENIRANRRLFVNGNVGIPTHNAYYYDSDVNLKENITPIENSLSKVMQLNGVVFNWKESGIEDIGFIAQEIEEYFPKLVFTDPESGEKSLDYIRLVVPLAEAIKEQQREIEKLKTEIEDLKK